MRLYKFQTKGQWGEDIIRTEGKATYYLSLIRGGTYFGLQKLSRMISSCKYYLEHILVVANGGHYVPVIA